MKIEDVKAGKYAAYSDKDRLSGEFNSFDDAIYFRKNHMKIEYVKAGKYAVYSDKDRLLGEFDSFDDAIYFYENQIAKAEKKVKKGYENEDENI